MELSKLREIATHSCVLILSPFSGAVEMNKMYCIFCMKDSLDRGEAPFASHLLYPPILQKYDAEATKQRISCGMAWMRKCDLVAIYLDFELSVGMIQAKAFAEVLQKPIEERRMGNMKWLRSYRQAL